MSIGFRGPLAATRRAKRRRSALDLRGVSRQLVELARRVNRARKAMQRDRLQERARALGGVLKSIQCEFEAYTITGGKTRHRLELARVKFVPLLGRRSAWMWNTPGEPSGGPARDRARLDRHAR
jgi:hypothetical protein